MPPRQHIKLFSDNNKCCIIFNPRIFSNPFIRKYAADSGEIEWTNNLVTGYYHEEIYDLGINEDNSIYFVGDFGGSSTYHTYGIDNFTLGLMSEDGNLINTWENLSLLDGVTVDEILTTESNIYLSVYNEGIVGGYQSGLTIHLGSYDQWDHGIVSINKEDKSINFLEIDLQNPNNENSIVIFRINVKDIENKLKWEKSRDNQLFPHLYGFIDFFNVKKMNLS